MNKQKSLARISLICGVIFFFVAFFQFLRVSDAKTEGAGYIGASLLLISGAGLIFISYRQLKKMKSHRH